MEKIYGGILESVSSQDGEQFTLKKGKKDNILLYYTEEVAFAKNNWPNSALGPDGVDM